LIGEGSRRSALSHLAAARASSSRPRGQRLLARWRRGARRTPCAIPLGGAWRDRMSRAGVRPQPAVRAGGAETDRRVGSRLHPSRTPGSPYSEAYPRETSGQASCARSPRRPRRDGRSPPSVPSPPRRGTVPGDKALPTLPGDGVTDSPTHPGRRETGNGRRSPTHPRGLGCSALRRM